MRTYHKIQNIFNRETFGNNKLIENDYTNKTVEFLKDVNWIWTEKVDGMNIRVYWDGFKVSLGGRTDKADIPSHLKKRLEELFCTPEKEEIFESLFGEKEVILFGEGYGVKIQKGENYIDNVDFILFDIQIGNNFLERKDVEDIASSFNIDVVPIVGHGTLEEAINFVKTKPMSTIGKKKAEMEGIVVRPSIELNERNHNRVIVKIKARDF